MALTTAQIQNAYVAFFNRPADVAGLNYWTNYNGSTADLFNAFAGSQEYKALFTGQNSTQVVNTVYQNLFGRSPDVDGLNYWVGELDAGKLTVANIANAVNAGALGADKTIIDNKVAAATSFTTALDTTAEIVGYAQASSATLSQVKTWLSTVTDQASSLTAANAALPALATTVASGAAAASLNASLTTGQDNIVGTTGNDTFTARIFDNSNTLQSGDKISGGSGTDTLFADIGNSQNFAITPETTGVERVAIRAQATPRDATNGNNTSSGTDQNFTNIVQIDAQRMSGVTQWESNNSRADVVIEDVRILDTQKTSAVTIAMVETDPGNVDFAVYFDQLSLRNTGSSTSSLNVFLMDTAAAAATPTTPLLNHNFNTYTFFNDGKKVILGGANTPAGTAIDDAKTYAQLKDAFVLALKTANVAGTVTDLSNTVTVTTSGPVNMTNEAAKSAESSTVAANFLGLTGEVITFTINGSSSITSSSGGEAGGWTAAGPAPSTGAIVQTLNSGTNSSAELVTSKVILDDVGRGSTGGDLVIGGQSTGDTSTSRGVERFEIEVRDNSKLQTINSTNNALREVTIVNGATSNTVENAYVKTVKDAGNLTVNGDAAQALAGGVQSGGNNQLPGVENNSPVGLHHGAGAAGFVDVRLIDASAFKGKLAFTADITADSIAKYVNLVDTNGNPVADVAGTGNVNFDVRGANFAYTGGSNNDTMVVTIDGGVAGSRSKVVSGQSDFTFDVTGGAGDDAITVSVITPRASNGDLNWYNNQNLNNNIAINGGDGADTIRTPGAGDLRIDAGAGNDVLYTDNTGVQVNATDAARAANVAGGKAQWVLNTTNQTTADLAGASILAVRNINDLRSDTNESYNLYKATVMVAFKDLPSKAITIESTGYKTTDLQINQAIKKAINDDVVLNKLLVAQDGPANSLVINSLIDGVMSNADLTVAVSAPAASTLNSTDILEAGKVYLAAGTTATDANVLAAMNTALVAFTGRGDYVDQMANDGAIDIVGANSVTASDNLITLGAGDDIAVLGTTLGANTANSSNETIVIGTGFGNDTVVNFAVAGNGQDYFDFTALKGTTLTAGYTTDKSITIQAATTLATSTTITEKTAIETLFNANNATAQDHVFLSVNAHNVASVYTVADAAGAANAVATLQGTIDLGDHTASAWTSLTGTNFVNSSAPNYFQINGPTGLNGTAGTGGTGGGTGTGTGTAQTVAVTAANSVTETAATNTTFNVAAGNYTYNIAGFSAGDKLVFPSGGVAPTVNNTDYTDGIIDVQFASGGTTTLIHLTGLPETTFASPVFSVASFNTIFGAGSLV